MQTNHSVTLLITSWKWGSELLGVMNMFSTLVLWVVLKVCTHACFHGLISFIFVLLIVCQ